MDLYMKLTEVISNDVCLYFFFLPFVFLTFSNYACLQKRQG